MNCLWCDQEIVVDVSWRNFLNISKPKRLCQACERQLIKISGERCKKCSRRSQHNICYDCKRWENDDPLSLNYSVFMYNERMQEMIAKWKYRGDYTLGYAFQHEFNAGFHQFFSMLEKDTKIVPIPLSVERLEERGFNQAKLLADFLPLEQKQIMTRKLTEKQAKKTRRQRMSMKNPFILQECINNPVLLVDDIYTTGTTLRHAARLLKANGCQKIYAYTLIRG